ncbi:hypothetical protein TKK_0006275 [Trichogramma kaykai]|uniref:BTB domain-containing protein n=1 Tax=Trichogramma kaykai TaxID=54128 RepID=A0ABD2XDC4_9HYME
MESNECPSSKIIPIQKSLYEPIDFVQNFELELTQNGPKETVDVEIHLRNFVGYDSQPTNPLGPQWPSPPADIIGCYLCPLCHCYHQKLQMTARLQFRNIAHLFQLDPRMVWSYGVEACVTARLPNIALPAGATYNLSDPQQMSSRRTDAYLIFHPFEYVFHEYDNGDYNFRIVDVRLKISKTKLFYVDESQGWQIVNDDLGPCFRDLYPKILTFHPDCGCNVIIHVGPATLKAHKKVLSAKSYKLLEFFHGNQRATEIHFLNVEVDVVRAMLEFFYTNQLDCLSLVVSPLRLCDLLIRIFRYATTWDMDKFRIACLDHIPFAVTPETASIFSEFADSNNLTYLHLTLEKYIHAMNLRQPAEVSRQ